MPTQQQDVTAEKNKLAELKHDLMVSIRAYLAIAADPFGDRDAAILECQRKGNAYFNHAEEFVGNSDLLGAHNCDLWAQGFAEDCAEILKSMPAHYELIGIGFVASPRLSNVSFRPGDTAYANMQRMVTRYLTKEQAKEIEHRFCLAGLPIYGFKNKAKNYMQRDKLLSFIFGVGFMIVMLVIAFVKPDPSQFQYSVFRTVLALAGAGIGAVIPGFLQVSVKSWIRAGGAIAIFILVYFWNPAQLV
jgi:hypothetical protein